MKFRPRHVGLVAALAAIAVVLPLTGSAQANTTLPGINGKLAYTTNADIFTEFGSDAVPATRGAVKCPIFAPLGAEAGFGFDALFCGAEIATINPDGTGFAQLTNDTFPDDKPAWLPQDGSKLVYQSTLHDSDCIEKSIICGYNLYDIAPDGSSIHQLTTTHDPISEPGLFNSSTGSYSPDGSQIAFEALNQLLLKQSVRDQPEDPLVKQFNHFLQSIYTIPAGGESAGSATPLIPATDYEQQNALVSDSQPTWSPDGSKIAFVRLTMSAVPAGLRSSRLLAPDIELSSSIYTVPASGGEPTPVESTEPCDTTIQMAEAVAGQAAGAPPLAGGRGLLGGALCTFDAAPAWSPDGSKIAVERVTFPAGLVLDARSQSRGLVQIFEDSDIVTFNSTDGSGEVNVSDVTEPADCGTIDALKSGVACGSEQKPAWSPDGTKIAFFSDRNSDGVFPFGECEQIVKGTPPPDCDDEIWTVNADGTSPFQVTDNSVNDINPDWQRIPPPPVAPPPPTPPAAPAAKPKVSVAGVRSACVAKTFHVRFRVTTASSVKSVVVKLDGRRIKSTKKGSFTLTINGKKLKSGRHRLTITATDSNGSTTTTHKSFSVCKAAKPRRQAAPRFTG